MFDGNNPEVATAEQRRQFNPDELFVEYFPSIAEREQKFLNSTGARYEDKYFVSSRGVKLFSRTLYPGPDESIKGAVLICHGYSDNLRWLLRKKLIVYAERGFITTGVEVEGHGWSDGRSALIPDIDAAINDVDEYLAEKQAQFPELKWHVYGASMGGLFALHMCFKAQKRKKPLSGATFVAPMCKIAPEVKPPQFVVPIAIQLSKIAPTLSIVPSSMDAKVAFKDQELAAKINMDPLKYIGRPRLGTAASLFQATLELEDNIKDLKTAFMVIHGDEDMVTSPEASIELYEKAIQVPISEKKLLIVEGGYHGVLWDTEENMEFLWGEILDWAESCMNRN